MSETKRTQNRKGFTFFFSRFAVFVLFLDVSSSLPEGETFPFFSPVVSIHHALTHGPEPEGEILYQFCDKYPFLIRHWPDARFAPTCRCTPSVRPAPRVVDGYFCLAEKGARDGDSFAWLGDSLAAGRWPRSPRDRFAWLR